MIRYALACKSGHGFEGWFASSADYDRQREGELVQCPACGSADISKELMAPAVATARKREERSEKATNMVAASVPATLDGVTREKLRQLR